MEDLTRAHLQSLSADRASLAVLDPTLFDRTVPSCPDWDLAGLLGHLGWVHRFAAMCLVADVDADLPFPDIQTPTGATLIAWIDDGIAALLSELDPTDLDLPCPTFVGPATRRWWLRRQAFETAVHRWDAQRAVGEPEPIPNAGAGIDEWFDLLGVRRWTPPPSWPAPCTCTAPTVRASGSSSSTARVR